MPEETPLPDYYAILQVHPEAEADVILAAYRSLMRKYHPDNLPIEQRQDEDVVKKVQLINQAFEVLSDPFQRAAYDVARKHQIEKISVLQTPGLETRVHMVRCAQNHLTYRMLLARKAGLDGLFRVTGFELIESLPTDNPDRLQGDTSLSLPEGEQTVFPLGKLIRWFKPNQKRKIVDTYPPKFPNQKELRELFDSSDTLNFGEIDWAGYSCPSCHSEYRLTDGVIAHWCHCSGCGRIYCSGGLHATPLGDMTQCPFCRRITKITWHVKPGQVGLPVKGEVARSKNENLKLSGNPNRNYQRRMIGKLLELRDFSKQLYWLPAWIWLGWITVEMTGQQI